MLSDEDYFNSLPRKRSGAGALIKNGSKFLIVKPSYKEGWEIPGGVVELGESPLQTVVREVKEETNLDIQVNELALVDFSSEGGHRGDAIHFIFIATVPEGKLSVLLNKKELTAYKFVTKEEAIDLLIPIVGHRVRAVVERKDNNTLYTESGVNVLTQRALDEKNN